MKKYLKIIAITDKILQFSALFINILRKNGCKR